MSHRLRNEELLSLREVTQYVPRSNRTGRKIHRSTIYRWALKGVRAQDGARVFLEVIKAPSLSTSQAALHRFFDELSKRASLPHDSPVSADSLPHDRSRLSSVERELDEAGL